MPDTPYDKQTWRDMGISSLVDHASDTVKLARQHYDDNDDAALRATLDQLKDQVDVLHDRGDELSAAIAERTADALPPVTHAEGALPPALQE